MGRFGGESFGGRRSDLRPGPQPVSFEREPQPWNPEILRFPITLAEKRRNQHRSALERKIGGLKLVEILKIKQKFVERERALRKGRANEDVATKIAKEKAIIETYQARTEAINAEEAHKRELMFTLGALIEGGFVEYAQETRDVDNVILRFVDQPQENN